MRADVSTLNQGIRNANDAISMIQTADGALAVIDEKLIRMKELAEQAATGTYNSTQRLIISSEYQAMAAEIDRIAHATDFNGIKLLDGSLSGTHNGKGLNSTGAMKIHFGTGNASAEDYYYVEIGACTTEALGLGSVTGGTPSGYREIMTVIHKTFKPQTSYVEYTDPDTGKKYYSDGDFYFENFYNPVGTTLDWETDGKIIERLKTVQNTSVSNESYSTYVDPVTNIRYYKNTIGGSPYVLDPTDPNGTKLDSVKDKGIIDRLQNTHQGFSLSIYWDIYLDPSGKRYYSYDKGKTFVPNTSRPSENILDARNPSDNEIIKTFTPEMVIKKVPLPSIYTDYLVYETPDPRKPGSYKTYYSSDGGKTFVGNTSYPDIKLDPNNPYDKGLIDGMQPVWEDKSYSHAYEVYRDKTSGTKYYKTRYNDKYLLDVAKPDQVALDGYNPADAAAIANLEPVYSSTNGAYSCDVYRDTTNPAKMYYTKDNGKTFFSELNDMEGSVLDASNPDYYNGILDNLEKMNATAQVGVPVDIYSHPTKGTYYSADGGKTFVSYRNSMHLEKPDLDINNP